MQNFYNKIAEWLCGFEPDKYVHFIVMLVFTFLFSNIMVLFFEDSSCHYPSLMALDLACMAGLTLSVLKENWDLRRGGVFDMRDMAADIAGIACGGLMSLM